MEDQRRNCRLLPCFFERRLITCCLLSWTCVTTRRQAFVNSLTITSLLTENALISPSYRVTPGQVISVRKNQLKFQLSWKLLKQLLDVQHSYHSMLKIEGSLTRLPERDEINPESTKHLSLNSPTRCFNFKRPYKKFTNVGFFVLP